MQLSGREPLASSSKRTAKHKRKSVAGKAVPTSCWGPLTATLKASPALRLDREAPRACKPGVGKQRDGQRGSRGGRMDTGAPGCAEEAGAKRVSPGVSSACTRQPLPRVLSRLLTPSERGSSPLLWPEEYRLTYSPSPASSLAFSL